MKFLHCLKDEQWRKHNIRYWLLDPFWGSLDYLTHYTLRYTSFKVNARIGAFLGEIAGKYRFKPTNARVKKNLAILRPDLTESERDELAIKMWRNLGQTMTEYSIADLLWKKGHVEVENASYISDCQSQGVPIIFVTGHFANWEVIGGGCKENNISLLSIYQPLKNRFTTQIAVTSRARIGLQIIPAELNAFRAMSKHIAQGGALWFAIDEYKTDENNVEQVLRPQLGRNINARETNMANVVRLAERFNAAIIPYKTTRKPNSHFTVTFNQPLKVNNNSAETILTLDQLLESWVRESPEDWYMLHLLRF